MSFPVIAESKAARVHASGKSKGNTLPPASNDWSLADLLDFEFYLERDERVRLEGGETQLERRDRSHFLAITGTNSGRITEDTPQVRRRLFLGWLEQMRNSDEKRDLLPSVFARWLGTHISAVAILVGLLVGWGVASTTLYYGGAGCLPTKLPSR